MAKVIRDSIATPQKGDYLSLTLQQDQRERAFEQTERQIKNDKQK